MINIETLAERLSEARKNSGLSQSEAAEKIGVNTSTLSRYETGLREPMFGFLRTASKVYAVNLNWLVTGETPSEKTNVEISEEEKSLLYLYRQASEFTKGQVVGILQSNKAK